MNNEKIEIIDEYHKCSCGKITGLSSKELIRPCECGGRTIAIEVPFDYELLNN